MRTVAAPAEIQSLSCLEAADVDSTPVRKVRAPNVHVLEEAFAGCEEVTNDRVGHDASGGNLFVFRKKRPLLHPRHVEGILERSLAHKLPVRFPLRCRERLLVVPGVFVTAEEFFGNTVANLDERDREDRDEHVGDWEHQGSLVAKERIKWFIGENTPLYPLGEFLSLVKNPNLTVGQIVDDLYEMRNFLAHGDKLNDHFLKDTLRDGINGRVTVQEVLFEAQSFIIRTSLLKILRDGLLDHFAEATIASLKFLASASAMNLSQASDMVTAPPLGFASQSRTSFCAASQFLRSRLLRIFRPSRTP